MNLALIVIFTIAICEIALRLPLGQATRSVAQVMRKSSRLLLRSKASDHWKEKAMLAYSSRMFVATMRLIGLLVVLLGLAGLGILGLHQFGTGFGAYISGLQGSLVCLGVATLYLWMRARLAKRL
ncbi:MAG: hypothetical protein R3360_02020 [Alphaproteobacteria bacterium]|nr:hypothetical protein [Alphaproteobacteria bacterium]